MVTAPASVEFCPSPLPGAKTTLIVQRWIDVAPGRVVPHVPGLVVDWLKSLFPLKLTLRPFNCGSFAGLITVRVMVRVVPLVTLPKDKFRSGIVEIGLIPVPFSVMDCDVPGLATLALICPSLAPGVSGRKANASVQVPPGPKVAGKGVQASVDSPQLEILIPVIVKFARGLVFVTVTV